MNKLYFSIGLLFLSFLCFAKAAPSISYTTEEQIAYVGETVKLNCSVELEGNYTIVWVKNSFDGPKSLSIGSQVVTSDPRFSVQFNASSSTNTLQIKDIQEGDTGTYQCQLHSPENMEIVADVKLSVHRVPVITASQNEIAKYAGDTVEMVCSINNGSNYTIKWMAKRPQLKSKLPIQREVDTNGSRVVVYRNPSSSTLRIKDINRTDIGLYQCYVDLSLGHRISADVKLTVRKGITMGKIPRIPRKGKGLIEIIKRMFG